MGLHLPEAPPPDSDEEEEDAEVAAAQRSRASIPMDAGEACPPLVFILTHPLPVSWHHFLSPRRPRGASEEDNGSCGIALSQCAIVGQGDLRRPVGGRGPEGTAEPPERRCPATHSQEQHYWTWTPTGPLTGGQMYVSPVLPNRKPPLLWHEVEQWESIPNPFCSLKQSI